MLIEMKYFKMFHDIGGQNMFEDFWNDTSKEKHPVIDWLELIFPEVTGLPAWALVFS